MFQARTDAKLGQVVVAAKLGISQGTLSDLEGVASSSGRVAEFADLYKVDARWLAAGTAAASAQSELPPSDRAAHIARQMDLIPDPDMRGRAMVLCANLVELAQAGRLDSALSVLQALAPLQPPAQPTAQPDPLPSPQSAGGRAKRT